eukprot:6190391-Pleurochrysis_carterae.AAC.1
MPRDWRGRRDGSTDTERITRDFRTGVRGGGRRGGCCWGDGNGGPASSSVSVCVASRCLSVRAGAVANGRAGVGHAATRASWQVADTGVVSRSCESFNQTRVDARET